MRVETKKTEQEFKAIKHIPSIARALPTETKQKPRKEKKSKQPK